MTPRITDNFSQFFGFFAELSFTPTSPAFAVILPGARTSARSRDAFDQCIHSTSLLLIAMISTFPIRPSSDYMSAK
ncbi:unnamed protein product [Periconia digitata]|uniref:Uncharacterized protein n=1 Tax=Periconia digitata TaxID=1303443 RepID=A0A9W4XJ90_9PLEO|nr:unnamed protein product [Periconia digitata]